MFFPSTRTNSFLHTADPPRHSSFDPRFAISSIQIPITFVQAEAFFYTDTQRDETEDLIDEFISDYVKPRASRVFLWETEDTLNFGTILTRDGVLEMHYIAVEVGK